MTEEVVLMKGNEAIAHAAVRIGVDGYFGYPITPQSEVLETLAELKPWKRPEWSSSRPKVKLRQSTWYTEAQEAERW